MIDFTITEEEELIRNSARSFGSEKLRPSAEKHEEGSRVEADVAKGYRELGLSLLEVPQDLGGAGLGTFAKTLVLEELGWGDAGAALAVEGVWPAFYAILEAGSKELQKTWLNKLAESGEPPRSVLVYDVDQRLQLKDGTLDGSAPFVTTSATDLAVVLRDGEILFVEGGGIKFKPVTGCALQATGPSEATFSASRIVHRSKDAAAFERTVGRLRIYVSALMVGVARAATEYAMKYAQERSTFGKPIAHHQAIAFYLAEMSMAVDAARASLWRAVYQLQTGQEVGWHAAAAYQEAAQQSRFATDWAVQILGGHGFIKDHPVEKWMRDAQVLSSIWGGVDQADLDGAELVLAA